MRVPLLWILGKLSEPFLDVSDTDETHCNKPDKNWHRLLRDPTRIYLFRWLRRIFVRYIGLRGPRDISSLPQSPFLQDSSMANTCQQLRRHEDWAAASILTCVSVPVLKRDFSTIEEAIQHSLSPLDSLGACLRGRQYSPIRLDELGPVVVELRCRRT